MENILAWDEAVRWMESLLPVLERVAVVLVYFWITILLPMSMFRKMHAPIARCLQASSWYMCALCCWFSVIVTNQIVGWMGVTLGLFAGVVGIIPVGIAGATIQKDWNDLTLLLIGLVLILIPRIVAKIILNRGERARLIRIRSYAQYY